MLLYLLSKLSGQGAVVFNDSLIPFIYKTPIARQMPGFLCFHFFAKIPSHVDFHLHIHP